MLLYISLMETTKKKTYSRYTKDNKKETSTYYYRKLRNHKRRVQKKKKGTERNYKTANN